MFTLTGLHPYEGPRLHAFTFPNDVAVFAVGDVHGQKHKLDEILNGLADVPTPNQKRVLIFLGDLIDRGPDSLGTLRLAATARREYGFDEALFLPGNHELMMLDALARMAKGGLAPKADGLKGEPDVANWLYNGGAAALAEVVPNWGDDWAADARTFTAALPSWDGQPLLEHLATGPTYARFGDALFVHAGVAPKRPVLDTLGLSRVVDRDTEKRHWAWIRRPFLEWPFGWPEDGVSKKGDGKPGLLVVHGHTAPAEVHRDWVKTPDRLLKGLNRVKTLARLNLDGGAANGHLVAGALFTHNGWHLAAADGLG